MRILGTCDRCGKPTMHTCPLCGRPVCEEHRDRETGLCYQCLGKVRVGEIDPPTG